jgi:hypothetical protein
MTDAITPQRSARDIRGPSPLVAIQDEAPAADRRSAAPRAIGRRQGLHPTSSGQTVEFTVPGLYGPAGAELGRLKLPTLAEPTGAASGAEKIAETRLRGRV